ncbi:hypothetical protein GCM10025867_07600 [Frondihabitans sucicola]|uniref:Uncharacterized protein n=1 Tax=Frondihabitans sucicola TaxID=1268041 RepID=A0ABM8GJF1_9MICO|nr:hypothetical protein [Frondihabitans sucicola]BDZ48519.1 hypothetical protein GCM10025867_07600 [Frondihabitans sucicola]
MFGSDERHGDEGQSDGSGVIRPLIVVSYGSAGREGRDDPAPLIEDVAEFIGGEVQEALPRAGERLPAGVFVIPPVLPVGEIPRRRLDGVTFEDVRRAARFGVRRLDVERGRCDPPRTGTGVGGLSGFDEAVLRELTDVVTREAVADVEEPCGIGGGQRAFPGDEVVELPSKRMRKRPQSQGVVDGACADGGGTGMFRIFGAVGPDVKRVRTRGRRRSGVAWTGR